MNFKKKPGILYFQLNQMCIATTPLVMTQTLNRVATPLFSSMENAARYLLLERPENDRLLSGYNKKILASAFDIRKRILLKMTGLTYGMEFEHFLSTLCQRHQKSQFIDRHFVPQRVLHYQIDDTKEWEKIDIANSTESILRSLPKIKSSRELYYTRGIKTGLTENDENCVKKYLALWK